MNNRLTHRQLEGFRAVIKTGKVTAAASALNTTQPSVSRMIADLESVTGFKLFNRQGRQLIPTSEALALYEEVERSFVGLSEISRVVEDIRDFRKGSLLIAGMPALSLHFLPKAISTFIKAEPGITVSLRARSSQAVLQHLSSQQFDMGFAEHSSEHPAVQRDQVWSGPMQVILPVDHPLCAKTYIEPADLHEQAFISQGIEDPTQLAIDRLLAAEAVRPRIVAEAQLSASICEMVADGIGLSIIEPVTALYFANMGKVVARPLAPEVLFQYELLLPALWEPSRVATRFLEVVDVQFAELFDEGT